MDVLKPRLAVLARLNGAAFYQFCRDLRISHNGSGQITITPPALTKSGFAGNELFRQPRSIYRRV